MEPIALVRRVGGGWSSPSRRGFGLEVELEQLIHDYPEVLPGVSAAAIAVTQFSVPSGGSVDLVVLEPDATVTVVECKLAKNAEVRRAVVGQIFSYASSLTQLDVDGFLDQFDRCLGGSVIELLTPEAGTGESEDWDEDRFRSGLVRTLADGAFRLVIAVDRITDELRGIVEYLNTRTDERVEVLALEVDLITHEGVEVLIPRVHGLESTRLKAQRGSGSRGASRDLGTALAAFDDAFAPDARTRIESFFADLREAGGQLRPGTGAAASVIGVLRTSKGVRSLWSITLDEGPLGGTQFFCNVNTWVGAFGSEAVDAVLDAFATNPALAPIASSVRERGVEKLHRVRADTVFSDGAATDRLRTAMTGLITTQDDR